MRDMFGNEVTIEEARALLKKGPKRKPTQPNGYAAPPGTGPQGETCGSCKWLYRNHQSKTYLKCEKNRPFWTGGPGSDIRAKAPACREWGADRPER